MSGNKVFNDVGYQPMVGHLIVEFSVKIIAMILLDSIEHRKLHILLIFLEYFSRYNQTSYNLVMYGQLTLNSYSSNLEWKY